MNPAAFIRFLLKRAVLTKRFWNAFGAARTIPNAHTISNWTEPKGRIDVMKVHVLTDDVSVGRAIEESMLGLGYECSVVNRIADLKSKLTLGEAYYLVLDYLLAEGDCRELLLELLKSDKRPSGLLVMSGLPGFEEFLNEVSDQYADSETPFLFLEKPFDRAELGELLFRLGEGIQGRIFGCLRLPKYNYLKQGKLGPILRAARENLGLEPQQVASGACNKGIWITAERLEEIEADETGANISCDEWFVLTRLLNESADCANIGLEPWLHLRRVRHALEEKTYPFTMNFTLRRNLVELARREKIESTFSDVTNYRTSRPLK